MMGITDEAFVQQIQTAYDEVCWDQEVANMPDGPVGTDVPKNSIGKQPYFVRFSSTYASDASSHLTKPSFLVLAFSWNILSSPNCTKVSSFKEIGLRRSSLFIPSPRLVYLMPTSTLANPTRSGSVFVARMQMVMCHRRGAATPCASTLSTT